ncbi:hypothetical protein OQA88_1810 [Cercophora sp. LCS_1]
MSLYDKHHMITSTDRISFSAHAGMIGEPFRPRRDFSGNMRFEEANRALNSEQLTGMAIPGEDIASLPEMQMVTIQRHVDPVIYWSEHPDGMFSGEEEDSTYYSALFSLPQKQRSPLLTKLWRHDPFHSEWDLLCSTYSAIRPLLTEEGVTLQTWISFAIEPLGIVRREKYMRDIVRREKYMDGVHTRKAQLISGLGLLRRCLDSGLPVANWQAMMAALSGGDVMVSTDSFGGKEGSFLGNEGSFLGVTKNEGSFLENKESREGSFLELVDAALENKECAPKADGSFLVKNKKSRADVSFLNTKKSRADSSRVNTKKSRNVSSLVTNKSRAPFLELVECDPALAMSRLLDVPASHPWIAGPVRRFDSVEEFANHTARFPDDATGFNTRDENATGFNTTENATFDALDQLCDSQMFTDATIQDQQTMTGGEFDASFLDSLFS